MSDANKETYSIMPKIKVYQAPQSSDKKINPFIIPKEDIRYIEPENLGRKISDKDVKKIPLWDDFEDHIIFKRKIDLFSKDALCESLKGAKEKLHVIWTQKNDFLTKCRTRTKTYLDKETSINENTSVLNLITFEQVNQDLIDSIFSLQNLSTDINYLLSDIKYLFKHYIILFVEDSKLKEKSALFYLNFFHPK